jgi:hypothetical protein
MERNLHPIELCMLMYVMDYPYFLLILLCRYFFFLYAWSAYPPYNITHLSHSFIPYDVEEHRGVYFPTGLQLLPPFSPSSSPTSASGTGSGSGSSPSLLISYGKDDYRAMMLTLSGEAVQEYLKPIQDLNPQTYKFCTVGRGVRIQEVMKA